MKEGQDQTGTIVGSALGGGLIIGGSVIIAVLIWCVFVYSSFSAFSQHRTPNHPSKFGVILLH